ncbi:class I SAM-dependent methyltransferase [Virgibacillus sp. DJP39]|uniref:class I SAM-dependent methyltransferase n=1 Tax=Virgibacillus sp. DJP39 TaxID=3409790 RepID=UPI003BB51DA1
MKEDQLFSSYLEAIDQRFEGWDFSYISETGRMGSELLSWSYGSMVKSLMHSAKSMLDMGTGGGEFLSMLRPFPDKVCATEAYEPNIRIARNRLEPLGVGVFPIKDDTNLPFEKNQFDFIVNKHAAYSPNEVRRIVREDGIFLTQQVGGSNCSDINKYLGTTINEDFLNWNMEVAETELKNHFFEFLYGKEEFPVQRFYDIGALVYYLKAIPWQVPDFSINRYEKELYQIHQLIQSSGYFEVKQHRFIIKAKAVWS